MSCVFSNLPIATKIEAPSIRKTAPTISITRSSAVYASLEDMLSILFVFSREFDRALANQKQNMHQTLRGPLATGRRRF